MLARLPFASFILAAALLHPSAASAEAVRVELKKSEQGWQLHRGGEPYLIRGAGGDASLERLAAAGANSLRTWGAEDLRPLLDRAHALGLTVSVGIWLGHERHGFDYRDEAQVAAQLERARQAVLAYREHPALLLWGVGNEMEGFADGDDPAVWQAVNDVAAMIKSLDPNHPIMTVTADIGGERVHWVHEKSPAIDIHGVNSYGGAPSLLERLREAGAHKPIVLTEFGPPGAWESPTAPWGAPYEMSSSAKADAYRASYEAVVVAGAGRVLGSYAFTWGHKMEATPTWFGLFLDNGAPLAAIDTLSELWTGEPPVERAPRTGPLVAEPGVVLKPGATLTVSADAVDPDGGELEASWTLRLESGEYLTGGDFRPMPDRVDGAIVAGNAAGATIKMPREPDDYRLYYTVYDEDGKAGTANLPLQVAGERRKRLPVVYADGFEGMPWAPSGWMGGVDELTLDGDHDENCYRGPACIRMRFTGRGWVGVAWQNPPNNWGDVPGGLDVSGARRLQFFARGEYGGERIGFGVGIVGDDKPFPDSGRRKVENVVLTSEWRQYEVKLRGMDLGSIKTGFYITLSGMPTTATVYLDEIRFIR